jgi:hypothetical protein
VITNFLGVEKSQGLVTIPYSYKLELSIQCVPDLVKQLVQKNIAIYQIVRFTKLNRAW